MRRRLILLAIITVKTGVRLTFCTVVKQIFSGRSTAMDVYVF